MRCIVTGGAGFIGGHLARALQRAQHQVLVIDKAWQPDFDVPGFAIDICSFEKLASVFEGFHPDVVFHLGGIADARAVLTRPVESVHINITGTVCVLEAARKVGAKRVILASSSWVYNAMSIGLVDEHEAFLPSGGGHIYTSAMIAREFLAHDFRKLYGLSFTILRYSPIYGPGMWPGLALNTFIRTAQEGGPLVVFGNGEEARTFLYVDDLVDAFVASLQDVASDQVYNLEGPRVVTVNELAERVSALFGNIGIVYRIESNRRGELRYSGRTVSCEKARNELGWTPQVDVAEGIIRVLDTLSSRVHTTDSPEYDLKYVARYG